MNVLITGGAGYIGAQLVGELSANKDIDRIVIYDNLSRGNYNVFLGNKLKTAAKVQFVKGDILDSRSLKKQLNNGINVVYHLAARVTTPFANLDPHIYEQVNHWGTAEVVSAVEESNESRLIYMSSTSVYGASDQQAKEDTRPNPKTFYGISKLRAEQHVNRLVEKGRAVILRAGNVYGYSPSMRFDAVINKFAFDANFLNRISIQGTGKQARAFIHVEAISKILKDILFASVPSGTYNLALSNYSVLELVDVYKELISELEFIFLDQHLEMRNFTLDTNLNLSKHLKLPEVRDLKTEIKEFLGNFAF